MKNIAFVFVAVGLLAGCNNDLETPYLEPQGLNNAANATQCETGHIAHVENITIPELMEACYIPDSEYSYCWVMYQNHLEELIVHNPAHINSVFFWFERYNETDLATTLCTNK